MISGLVFCLIIVNIIVRFGFIVAVYGKMNAESLNEKIASVLKSIGQISAQGAIYHGLHEQVMQVNTQVCSFCSHALHHPISAPLCRYSCCNAAVQAMTSGEPLFYQCWAGLLFVTVPVAPQNRCSGGITLGGFYAPEQHQDIGDAVAQSLGMWPKIDAQPFLTRLSSLRPITTSALRGLGHLAMEATFSGGLNSSDFFRAQNEKYLQQRRIAEAFADIRTQGVSTPDILGDTYQLVSFLSQNDRQGAMEFVSRYLARLLLASNWDLIKLKAHARTLLAVITSHDILNGIPWTVASSRELRHMSRLEQAGTTEETCHEVAEWIQQYFKRSDRVLPDGRSLGDRVLAWMQAHYQEPVTLPVAARAIGISVSTLVHRLPTETGKTFKQLLLEIRTSEAKKLLATSALEISAVAGNCGFFDQSHFTREFKRTINLTPGQFRKLLMVPENALRITNTRSLDETVDIAPPSFVPQKKPARRTTRR